MNLLEMREQLMKLSGRYDLVDPVTFADNGLDFFINAGQRYLDRKVEINQQIGRFFRTLDETNAAMYASAYTIIMRGCRRVDTVYLIDNLEKTKLEYIKSNDMNDNFLSMPFETGKPTKWAHGYFRQVPRDDSFAGMADIAIGFVDTHDSYLGGIVVFPAVPETVNYGVEIYGSFYTADLTEDDQTTIWSAEYPETLAKAAIREMEVFNRNYQGVKEYDAVLAEDILGITKDFIAYQHDHINQMEG